MKAATCFSGIGAPEAALPEADWLWHAELEPFPVAVMAARHPGSVNLGNVTADDFLQRASAFGRLDLIVGGPPCQDFSIAGKREGIAGDRGNLSLRWVEIIHGTGAAVAVTENVPGWLSMADNAFGHFLGALVGHDAALCSPLDGGGWPDAGMADGPAGRAAWRVADAQFFGLAQRRRRVFVVFSAGANGIDPAAVLFERKGVRGDIATRREAGEIAPTIPSRSLGGGGLGTDFDCDGGLVPSIYAAPIAPTLNAHFGEKQGLEDQHINGGGGCSFPSVSMCLNAGGMGGQDAESETLIPVNRCGFDVADTLTSNGDAYSGYRDERGLVPVAYSIMPMNSAKDYKARETDVAQPIMAGGPVGGNQGGDYILSPIAFDTTQITSKANGSNPKAGDACHPLAAGAHPPAIAFISQCAVRRLTPTECERLQGFPDGHTDIQMRGKPAADGPRYKALGDSMAVSVMRWILLRVATELSAWKAST